MTALQTWSQWGAEHVLNSIPAGLLIAALAWLLLQILASRIPASANPASRGSRFQNSGTRFAIWFSTLIVVVALPFVAALTPERFAAAATHPKLTLPAFWAIAIAAVWTLIAALALTRVAVGLWKLRAIRRNATALAISNLHPALQAIVSDFQATRTVAVSTSSDVRVPTAIGFFHPVILIPDWALRELSTEELRVILLHEFAHLRRWDDWTNLTQKLVRTIFFFHPAVWWIEKRLSLEREMACDDAVLAETRNPHAYAECLVSLAEKSFLRRGLVMAQAVISHARETSLRLAQILDVNRPSATRVSKPALGAAAALAVFSLAVLPEAPRIIAFEGPAPAPVLAAKTMKPYLPPASVQAVAGLGNQRVLNAAYRITTGTATNVRPSEVAPISPANHARQKPAASPAPLVVRAEAREPAPIPEFLFVMQTTQFDGSSTARMRFAVWRLTFATADGNFIRTELIVKQI